MQCDLINRKPADGSQAGLSGPIVKDMPNLLYDLGNILIMTLCLSFSITADAQCWALSGHLIYLSKLNLPSSSL